MPGPPLDLGISKRATKMSTPGLNQLRLSKIARAIKTRRVSEGEARRPLSHPTCMAQS